MYSFNDTKICYFLPAIQLQVVVILFVTGESRTAIDAKVVKNSRYKK